MRSKGIWKDLQLQGKHENNAFKACILMVYESIWNCRKVIENNVSKACIIAVFETIWNCRKNMKAWKQGRLRVQYNTFWYDDLKFWKQGS